MATWNEIKEFANSLSEEQLAKNVVLWREDEAIGEIKTALLDEDHYMGPDDEGCYPESEASEPLENLKKVYSKGHPILFENFLFKEK